MKILDKDAPVLRQQALPVEIKDFGTKKLSGILERMNTALDAQDDGVAIAAPQIGESLRIFIVKGSVLNMKHGPDVDESAETPPNMVFINPELTKLSRTKKPMEEGCLSVRWYYGKVRRSEKATVRALDERGKAFTLGASGLLAQAFQHEIDHLDGILFTDKATELEYLPPKKNADQA